jgi:hypothetical protein
MAALRWGSAVALVAVLTVTAGCQHCRSFWSKEELPPTGTVNRIVTRWENSVRFTHDAVNGGAALPGIAGRLYLLDGDKPLAGDGMLLIDLYDDRPLDVGQMPVRIDQYQIDSETLKRLLRKDVIGWGYTVFLPWQGYRPDMSKVHLFVRFVPAGASAPLYETTSSIAISDTNRPNLSVASHTMMSGVPPSTPHSTPQAIPQPRPLTPAPRAPDAVEATNRISGQGIGP